MDLQIVGKHIEITDAIKSLITEKIASVMQRYNKITQIRVSLHIDHANQIAEINVHFDGIEIHAKSSSENMYHSIDQVVEKTMAQLAKHKDKLIDQHHHR
jgi:putative sigma-54 modulation protein